MIFVTLLEMGDSDVANVKGWSAVLTSQVLPRAPRPAGGALPWHAQRGA